MPQTKTYFLFFICCFLLSSCTDFFKDDFQLNAPTETRIQIDFPSLVAFEIIQKVTPDQRGIINDISNSFVINNELNQPINRLKFGINIFDSAGRFEKNLKVSYIDSLGQSLAAFEKTGAKLFNNSFGTDISKEMVDVFILDQDILETNPFSGIYLGEAFYYMQPDSTPLNIPFISGFIDYKGDLQLRASGSQIQDYNINGRVSASGLFVGKSTSSASDQPSINLKNKTNTEISIQEERLQVTFIPSTTTSTIDSIRLTLNRN